MSIRVLIADDHPLIRTGVRSELAHHEEIDVVGEVMDGDQAFQLTEELHPDVLLLCVRMPGMKATQIVSRLQRTAQAIRVVILSAHDDAPTVLGMLKAGVKGYVVKDEDPGEVYEAIKVVIRGKTWLSPTVAEIMTGFFYGRNVKWGETNSDQSRVRDSTFIGPWLQQRPDWRSAIYFEANSALSR